MGSFNMSCFASGHNISPNNKTTIIPIFQQATYEPVELSLGDLKFSQYGFANTICYSDCFWGYAGPIIEGTYDDYGRFNLIENDINISNMVHFFNILHEKLFKVAQGSNSAHDLAIDFQSLYCPEETYTFEQLVAIWDEMWSVGQENRLFINERGSPRQLQFALLHHKAYKFFEDYCSKITMSGESFDQRIENFIQQSFMFTAKPFHNANKFPDMKDMLEDSLDFGLQRLSNLEGILFGNGMDYWGLYDNKKALRVVIENFVKKNPDDRKFNEQTVNKIKKLLTTVIKHRIINFGINSFDVKLTPMTYGYQDYNNSVGKNYLRFIEAVNGSSTKKTT